MKQKVRKVSRLLSRTDKAIDRFREKSKLVCKSNCGSCCYTNKVESTVLEFLPLAEFLWQNKTADAVLEQLAQTEENDHCIFYIPEPAEPSLGRCSIYEHRGLLCRLFGFAIRINKRGEPELLACKLIKESDNNQLDIFKIVNSKYPKPIMGLYYMQLADIDYALTKTMLPVNKAIQEAILLYGFNALFDCQKDDLSPPKNKRKKAN